MRKRCARRVLHNLCEEQKWSRVDWCTHMLRQIDGGRSLRVWVIVTGDETWVYQYDTETKQHLEVWVFPDENPPVKLKKNKQNCLKLNSRVFLCKIGHVATIPLENRKTVTADWYVQQTVHKIFQAWCKRRPRTDVHCLLLYHDNASADTAAVNLDFAAANDVHLVTHPPYSPDLAPCDWFLFPSVKWQRKGKQLQNVEDA